jgi:hypothetical protein
MFFFNRQCQMADFGRILKAGRRDFLYGPALALPDELPH